MPTPDEIAGAHARIAPHIRNTPVLGLEEGALCAAPVTLKLELFQHAGSFKARGAFNAILSEPVPEAGVVAVSGGNHGAAVAFAARAAGARATVFAPDFASPTKIARMRGFGAEVILGGDDFTALTEAFTDFAARTGARPIHPFDDPRVLAGQGTLGREIETQAPDLDALLVSVGGGGLIGGVASWFEGRIEIVAVESEGTATLAAALAEGPEARITPRGVAADSLGAPRIGARAYDVLSRFPATSVVVPDAEIVAAQRRLWEVARIVAEPGAATAVAALTSGAWRPGPGARVGVLICGGNADPRWFLD